MSPLTPIPTPGYLLAFDYDGTLALPSIPTAGGKLIEPVFFELIRRLKKEKEALWGIYTGRSLPHLQQGFKESGFPFLPDHVITREQEIYFPESNGNWKEEKEWNNSGKNQHQELFKKSRAYLEKMQRHIEKNTKAYWISEAGDPAGIVASSEAEMADILTFIHSLEKPDDLSFELNGVYLRFTHSDFNKGSCLKKIASLYHLSPGQCLAAGDNFNDLSMLKPEVAQQVICPKNAKEEIKVHVLSHGGTIGKGIASKGIVKALCHLFPNNKV